MRYKPNKDKFITNLNDHSCLIDIDPIIDYVQLWSKNVPISWITAIELEDNKLDFVGTDYVMTDHENYYEFKLVSGERMIIYKTKLTAKLYIPSSSLDKLRYGETCQYIYNWVTRIKPKKPVITQGRRMPDYLPPHEWLISRIDLCINIVNELDLETIEWFTKKETNIQKYYVTTSEGKEISGLSVGKRGGANLFCRMYKKWLDPNKRHDYLKYYFTDFYRLEYEARRTQIIRIPNCNWPKLKMNENKNFSTLLELKTPGNVLRLWKWCLQTRHPIFKDCEKPPVTIKPYKEDNNNDEIDKKRYSMIRGLLKPYRLEYSKKFDSIMKNIDKIFKDRGIVIKKDDLDKYNQEGVI